LKVFEPLVKVLRLVDGDVKPSMGYVYGELLKAKREIKEAFGNVEKNYRDVMAIVDKKMKDRLDSPLHVAAYMLNPYWPCSAYPIFGLFGFFFQPEQYFSLTTIQPEQYFLASFS